MPESEAYLLLFIAVAIVAGLCAYLGYLLFKIYQQKHQGFEPARSADLSKSQLSSWQSLNILARSVIAKQVPLTESAIRISALLYYVAPESKDNAEFQVFFRIMEQTAHIPQFDAWLALDAGEKSAYREEMQTIERNSSQQAEIAARQLAALTAKYCD